MDALVLLAGLALLVVGGELVVSHGVRVAEFFGISPMIIGLTIVALGTSLPELAVGIDGMRRGVGDLVLGNMVGTDIVNILLILGLSALIRPIAVPPGIVTSDLPMITLSSLFVLILAWDGFLSTGNGLVLLIAGLLYMTFVIVTAKIRGAAGDQDVATSVESDDGIETDVQSTPTTSAVALAADAGRPTRRVASISGLLLLVGLGAIILGSDLMLRGAIAIAQDLGVSETLIGLTIVAIGTSAPELITTIIATIRNERSLAFGNLVGSSTLNLTIILGLALLFSPVAVAVDPKLLRVSMPLMVLVGLACVPVFLTGRRISRLEGGLFVAAYGGYLAYTIANA